MEGNGGGRKGCISQKPSCFMKLAQGEMIVEGRINQMHILLRPLRLPCNA